MGKHSKVEKKSESIYEINDNKRKKSKKGFKWVVIILLLIIITLGGLFTFQVYRNGGGMKGLVTTFVGTDIDTIKKLEDIYVLCMGQSEGMTDTIIVAKYSPKNQQASIMSIPRDSYIGESRASATSYDKINSRYQEDPQETIDAVNDLTGLNIKYYVTVDTKALRELVDAIGGVEFDVPIDMDYDDSSQDLAIHLKKGYQRLNGEQAEGVVRFRHNNDYTTYPEEYGDNDLGRMRTQREFITTVLKQTLKATNITKINELINIAQKRVETNLSWEIIKNYLVGLLDFDTENLRTGVLPGAPEYINEISFFLVDRDEAKSLVKELFLSQPSDVQNDKTETNDSDEDSTDSDNTTSASSSTTTSSARRPSSLNIEIINGTGTKSKFSTAQDQLEARGYEIAEKGTTNVTPKTIIINRKDNNAETTNELKALLCTGITTTGEDTGDIDYTIIIGTDY